MLINLLYGIIIADKLSHNQAFSRVESDIWFVLCVSKLLAVYMHQMDKYNKIKPGH